MRKQQCRMAIGGAVVRWRSEACSTRAPGSGITGSAETTMFRLKVIFGARVAARSFAGQAAEMPVRCAALNRMTRLGMPDSYAA